MTTTSGPDHGHGHDHGHHHDHDDHHHGVSIWPDDPDHPLRAQDEIVLTSVGIDVGTATSQVLLSRLTLRRRGRELSSAFAVVDKALVHASAVVLTPYAEGHHIDERRLRAVVDQAFADAGIAPDDVDTGAVILTGETTRRRNARAIADMFATRSGRFVCATAGHHMEAVLAAHGSGAVARSERGPSRVLGIDVGGGTTKLSVSESGLVTATAALHVGARLVVVDDRGRIVRLEPAARRLAALTGHEWAVGEGIRPSELAELAATMADAIVAAVRGRLGPDGDRSWLQLTGPLTERGPYDAVVFSGGVAEYVYGRERRDFGDLGPLLARALVERADQLPGPVEECPGAIRATVLGASQHTVQVSGSTIHVGDRELLPLHNLRVVRPPVDLAGAIDPDQVAAAIHGHLAHAEVDPAEEAAFGFRWTGPPSFDRLEAFVEGVRRGVGDRLAAGTPLCLLFEGDVARTVGALLVEKGVTTPVISVDGIAVTELELVDIGALLPTSGTVPVALKSLVFAS